MQLSRKYTLTSLINGRTTFKLSNFALQEVNRRALFVHRSFNSFHCGVFVGSIHHALFQNIQSPTKLSSKFLDLLSGLQAGTAQARFARTGLKSCNSVLKLAQISTIQLLIRLHSGNMTRLIRVFSRSDC